MYRPTLVDVVRVPGRRRWPRLRAVPALARRARAESAGPRTSPCRSPRAAPTPWESRPTPSALARTVRLFPGSNLRRSAV